MWSNSQTGVYVVNGTHSTVPELNTMHSTGGISKSIPTLVLKIERKLVNKQILKEFEGKLVTTRMW